MKKAIILTTLFLISMTSFAYDWKMVGEFKEFRHVNEYPEVSASELYSKSLSAISKLSSQRNSSAIDLNDPEGKHLVLKFTEMVKSVRRGMIKIYGDFVLDIRCKDGKAQYIVTISGFDVTSSGRVMSSYSYKEAVDERESRSAKKRDDDGALKRADELVETVIDFLISETTHDKDDDF